LVADIRKAHFQLGSTQAKFQTISSSAHVNFPVKNTKNSTNKITMQKAHFDFKQATAAGGPHQTINDVYLKPHASSAMDNSKNVQQMKSSSVTIGHKNMKLSSQTESSC